MANKVLVVLHGLLVRLGWLAGLGKPSRNGLCQLRLCAKIYSLRHRICHLLLHDVVIGLLRHQGIIIKTPPWPDNTTLTCGYGCSIGKIAYNHVPNLFWNRGRNRPVWQGRDLWKWPTWSDNNRTFNV